MSYITRVPNKILRDFVSKQHRKMLKESIDDAKKIIYFWECKNTCKYENRLDQWWVFTLIGLLIMFSLPLWSTLPIPAGLTISVLLLVIPLSGIFTIICLIQLVINISEVIFTHKDGDLNKLASEIFYAKIFNEAKSNMLPILDEFLSVAEERGKVTTTLHSFDAAILAHINIPKLYEQRHIFYAVLEYPRFTTQAIILNKQEDTNLDNLFDAFTEKSKINRWLEDLVCIPSNKKNVLFYWISNLDPKMTHRKIIL